MPNRTPAIVLSLFLASLAIARDDDAKKAEDYRKMSEAASAKWDALISDLKIEDSFDPTNAADMKGKLIKITTDNLIGYRFSPGDFPFATTVEGTPVAGKYDSVVAAAIKKVEAQLGRSLGDSDDDGKWTVVARVEGRSGKLTKKVAVEGQVDDVKVTGERKEEVDAPIVTIIAAKIGPLAVAKDKGMVTADGDVAKP